MYNAITPVDMTVAQKLTYHKPLPAGSGSGGVQSGFSRSAICAS